MEIKKISASDYPRLYALWSANEIPRIFGDSYDEFDAYLQASKQLSYILIENNEIIGDLIATYDGVSITIYHILIDKNHRLLGYGSKLMEQLVSDAKELSYYEITLKTYTTNTGFMKFMKANNITVRDDMCIYQKLGK